MKKDKSDKFEKLVKILKESPEAKKVLDAHLRVINRFSTPGPLFQKPKKKPWGHE